MGMSSAQYRQQLQALLPPGLAWPTGEDAQLTQLLDAMAQELARVDARAGNLRDEADPRTTYEMLTDWERVAGLPTPCMAGVSQTLAERRDALHARIAERGGQSRAYFIALAERAGYTITISEFDPYTVDSDVDALLVGDDWRFAWQVNAPATTIREATVESAMDDPFRTWGNTQLECIISGDKPAHTVVLFAYQ